MRRCFGLFVVVGLIMPLAWAAEASAQGAVLQVTPQTVVRGQSVTVTGAGFSGSSAAIASGIDIRLDTRDAEVLANTNTSSAGTFPVPLQIPIPASTPVGEHLLIGTQVTVRGRHVFGAPGRTKLRVVAASAAAAVRAAGPGVPPAAPIATIFVLLALSGGIVVCIRRLRTQTGRTQPQRSR